MIKPKHYSDLQIEPIEYVMKNDLGFCEGNVIKYVSRWRDKGGLRDLEKAKTYIDRLIAEESQQRIDSNRVYGRIETRDNG
jgi:hypothetical protein